MVDVFFIFEQKNEKLIAYIKTNCFKDNMKLIHPDVPGVYEYCIEIDGVPKYFTEVDPYPLFTKLTNILNVFYPYRNDDECCQQLEIAVLRTINDFLEWKNMMSDVIDDAANSGDNKKIYALNAKIDKWWEEATNIMRRWMPLMK